MEDRYDRQMRIPGWGIVGQENLQSRTVLVAGAGGLGSSSSMLLSAAGIGHLKIVDRDVVEPTNLNRQILHWQADIDSPKIESALTKLRGLNPDVNVEGIEVDIGRDNVGSLLSGVDGIVDALDNFETRYLLNLEAIRLGIPLFHGSIYGFEGRATTISPGKTPCLRCIYESGPKPGVFPVAGPVPSVIGSIQALEVIKYFLGVGTSLCGRLLIFDGEDMVFSEVAIERNPNCPDCRDLRPIV
jgi:adenylyltransferase/sulfurtransferase